MNTDPRCHAFGDESFRSGTYRLAVVHVPVAELANARSLLHPLHDEKDTRRRRLLALFARLTARVDHARFPR